MYGGLFLGLFVFSLSFINSILSKTPNVTLSLPHFGQTSTGCFVSITDSQLSHYVLWYLPSFGSKP